MTTDCVHQWRDATGEDDETPRWECLRCGAEAVDISRFVVSIDTSALDAYLRDMSGGAMFLARDGECTPVSRMDVPPHGVGDALAWPTAADVPLGET